MESRSRRRHSGSDSDSDRAPKSRRKRTDRSVSGNRYDRRTRRSSNSEDDRSHRKAPATSRKDHSEDEEYRRHRSKRRDRREHSSDDNSGSLTSRRKYRERSRSWDRRNDGRSHKRERSRSPQSRKRNKRSPSPPSRKSRAPLPSQDESFRGEVAPGERPPEKQKPNFKPTGLLAKEANTVEGTTTVLKYHEPPEARKPPAKEQWRMYVFKKNDLLDTIQLYTRSAWLCGRDQKVTDLFLEHPSISKQHAVIQFRHKTTTNEFGDKLSKVKPYIIDLESANGTKLDGKKIETSKYMELLDQDVVSFGDSEREYVMMLPGAEK